MLWQTRFALTMVLLSSFFLASSAAVIAQDKPPASDAKPVEETSSGLEDFDAAMDLQLEAKDIGQRTKVIELLESAIKKGLAEETLNWRSNSWRLRRWSVPSFKSKRCVNRE